MFNVPEAMRPSLITFRRICRQTFTLISNLQVQAIAIGPLLEVLEQLPDDTVLDDGRTNVTSLTAGQMKRVLRDGIPQLMALAVSEDRQPTQLLVDVAGACESFPEVN